MNTTKELPIIAKKKKINLKKFVLLAKKVRASFEEEKRYLDEEMKKNENHNSNGFLPNF